MTDTTAAQMPTQVGARRDATQWPKHRAKARKQRARRRAHGRTNPARQTPTR